MDFNWALEQMKKGMKVGRKSCVSYIQLRNGKIVNADYNQVPMLLETLQSKDWELFEEPKITLSDNVCEMQVLEEEKVIDCRKDLAGQIVHAIEVTRIKEFVDEINKELISIDEDACAIGKYKQLSGALHRISNKIANLSGPRFK